MKSIYSELPTFKKLLLLFPVLYLLHDLEEIFTIEMFLIVHANIIPLQITAMEFALAFSLLWIFASIGCFIAVRDKKFLSFNPIDYLSFLVPGIFLANGIAHLLQFIFFKGYVPGMITSIVIIFPYSFFTVKYLLKEKQLTLKKFFGYLMAGFVLQAPLALVAHFLSNLILTFLL